jgi:hypothetical protein
MKGVSKQTDIEPISNPTKTNIDLTDLTMVAAKKVCKNNDDTYSGHESSPLGLGYSPRAEKIGTVRIGRDKCTWIVINKNGVYVWSKAINADDVGQVDKEEPVIVENTNCDISETSSEASETPVVTKKKAVPKAAAKKGEGEKTLDLDGVDAPAAAAPVADKPVAAPKKKLVMAKKKVPEEPKVAVTEDEEPKAKDVEEPPKKKVGLAKKKEPEPDVEAPAAKAPDAAPAAKPKKVLAKKVVVAVAANKDAAGEEGEEAKGEPAAKKPNAYIIFSNEIRPKVKEEFPDLSPKEIVAKIAQLWQEKKAEVAKK